MLLHSLVFAQIVALVILLLQVLLASLISARIVKSNISSYCYDDAIVSDLCPNGLDNVTNIIDDLLNDDD